METSRDESREDAFWRRFRWLMKLRREVFLFERVSISTMHAALATRRRGVTGMEMLMSRLMGDSGLPTSQEKDAGTAKDDDSARAPAVHVVHTYFRCEVKYILERRRKEVEARLRLQGIADEATGDDGAAKREPRFREYSSSWTGMGADRGDGRLPPEHLRSSAIDAHKLENALSQLVSAGDGGSLDTQTVLRSLRGMNLAQAGMILADHEIARLCKVLFDAACAAAGRSLASARQAVRAGKNAAPVRGRAPTPLELSGARAYWADGAAALGGVSMGPRAFSAALRAVFTAICPANSPRHVGEYIEDEWKRSAGRVGFEVVTPRFFAELNRAVEDAIAARRGNGDAGGDGYTDTAAMQASRAGSSSLSRAEIAGIEVELAEGYDLDTDAGLRMGPARFSHVIVAIASLTTQRGTMSPPATIAAALVRIVEAVTQEGKRPNGSRGRSCDDDGGGTDQGGPALILRPLALIRPMKVASDILEAMAADRVSPAAADPAEDSDGEDAPRDPALLDEIERDAAVAVARRGGARRPSIAPGATHESPWLAHRLVAANLLLLSLAEILPSHCPIFEPLTKASSQPARDLLPRLREEDRMAWTRIFATMRVRTVAAVARLGALDLDGVVSPARAAELDRALQGYAADVYPEAVGGVVDAETLAQHAAAAAYVQVAPTPPPTPDASNEVAWARRQAQRRLSNGDGLNDDDADADADADVGRRGTCPSFVPRSSVATLLTGGGVRPDPRIPRAVLAKKNYLNSDGSSKDPPSEDPPSKDLPSEDPPTEETPSEEPSSAAAPPTERAASMPMVQIIIPDTADTDAPASSVAARSSSAASARSSSAASWGCVDPSMAGEVVCALVAHGVVDPSDPEVAALLPDGYSPSPTVAAFLDDGFGDFDEFGAELSAAGSSSTQRRGWRGLPGTTRRAATMQQRLKARADAELRRAVRKNKKSEKTDGGGGKYVRGIGPHGVPSKESVFPSLRHCAFPLADGRDFFGPVLWNEIIAGLDVETFGDVARLSVSALSDDDTVDLLRELLREHYQHLKKHIKPSRRRTKKKRRRRRRRKKNKGRRKGRERRSTEPRSISGSGSVSRSRSMTRAGTGARRTAGSDRRRGSHGTKSRSASSGGSAGVRSIESHSVADSRSRTPSPSGSRSRSRSRSPSLLRSRSLISNDVSRTSSRLSDRSDRAAAAEAHVSRSRSAASLDPRTESDRERGGDGSDAEYSYSYYSSSEDEDGAGVGADNAGNPSGSGGGFTLDMVIVHRLLVLREDRVVDVEPFLAERGLTVSTFREACGHAATDEGGAAVMTVGDLARLSVTHSVFSGRPDRLMDLRAGLNMYLTDRIFEVHQEGILAEVDAPGDEADSFVGDSYSIGDLSMGGASELVFPKRLGSPNASSGDTGSRDDSSSRVSGGSAERRGSDASGESGNSSVSRRTLLKNSAMFPAATCRWEDLTPVRRVFSFLPASAREGWSKLCDRHGIQSVSHLNDVVLMQMFCGRTLLSHDDWGDAAHALKLLNAARGYHGTWQPYFDVGGAAGAGVAAITKIIERFDSIANEEEQQQALAAAGGAGTGDGSPGGAGGPGTGALDTSPTDILSELPDWGLWMALCSFATVGAVASSPTSWARKLFSERELTDLTAGLATVYEARHGRGPSPDAGEQEVLSEAKELAAARSTNIDEALPLHVSVAKKLRRAGLPTVAEVAGIKMDSASGILGGDPAAAALRAALRDWLRTVDPPDTSVLMSALADSPMPIESLVRVLPGTALREAMGQRRASTVHDIYVSFSSKDLTRLPVPDLHVLRLALASLAESSSTMPSSARTELALTLELVDLALTWETGSRGGGGGGGVGGAGSAGVRAARIRAAGSAAAAAAAAATAATRASGREAGREETAASRDTAVTDGAADGATSAVRDHSSGSGGDSGGVTFFPYLEGIPDSVRQLSTYLGSDYGHWLSWFTDRSINTIGYVARCPPSMFGPAVMEPARCEQLRLALRGYYTARFEVVLSRGPDWRLGGIASAANSSAPKQIDLAPQFHRTVRRLSVVAVNSGAGGAGHVRDVGGMPPVSPLGSPGASTAMAAARRASTMEMQRASMESPFLARHARQRDASGAEAIVGAPGAPLNAGSRLHQRRKSGVSPLIRTAARGHRRMSRSGASASPTNPGAMPSIPDISLDGDFSGEGEIRDDSASRRRSIEEGDRLISPRLQLPEIGAEDRLLRFTGRGSRGPVAHATPPPRRSSLALNVEVAPPAVKSLASGKAGGHRTHLRPVQPRRRKSSSKRRPAADAK